ncbi:MAG: low affinity iron permease family protein [Dehalococcoidia bacterium]
MTSSGVKQWFGAFSRKVAEWSAHPVGFALAVGLILAWAASGPVFGFSDTWQLVINTSTTVITFLMVFVIQNTQNRDAIAMQLKLDEIIRAVDRAQNSLIDLEDVEEGDLATIRERYTTIGAEARAEVADADEPPSIPRRGRTGVSKSNRNRRS